MLIELEYWKLRILTLLNFPGIRKVKLAGFKVYFGNIKHLKQLYKEIFIKKHYQCDFESRPVIIDGGANIGLAVLYFKHIRPQARIIAFEPNPESFSLLKKNVEQNHLSDVNIINAALGAEEKIIPFYLASDMPSADVGASSSKTHVEHHHAHKGKILETEVSCKTLSPYLKEKVALLKLDIEGFESQVISELGPLLANADNVIMEYHYNLSFKDNPLSTILDALEKNNHNYIINPVGKLIQFKDSCCYIIKSTKK